MEHVCRFAVITCVVVCATALSACQQDRIQSGAVDFGYNGSILKRATYVLQYRGADEARLIVEARGQRPLPTLDTKVTDTTYTSWIFTWRLENTGKRLVFAADPDHYPNGPNGPTDVWLTVYTWPVVIHDESERYSSSLTLALLRHRTGALEVSGGWGNAGFRAIRLNLGSAQSEDIAQVVDIQTANAQIPRTKM